MPLESLPLIQWKAILPNSFYEASSILIPKLDKDMSERKLWANFLDQHRYKNP
jgi:hypothetical protein